MYKLILIVAMLCSASAYSAEVYPSSQSYPTQIGTKLGHGLANVVTGWAEIPKNMEIRTHNNGILEGVLIGTPVGVVYAIGRSLSGAFDIATFFIPSKTFVHPGYIWEDWGRTTTFTTPR